MSCIKKKKKRQLTNGILKDTENSPEEEMLRRVPRHVEMPDEVLRCSQIQDGYGSAVQYGGLVQER